MPNLPTVFGHAPGHLRGPFDELVLDGQLSEEDTANGKPLTPKSLTGLLWDCTDIMPRDICADLDLPQGSSYAQGAVTTASGS